MTREEAITWCDRFNHAWSNANPEDDFPDVKYSDTLDQLFYLAGQALRQQERVGEANKTFCNGADAECDCPIMCGEITKKIEPLTLDELRKMDGEPIWVEFQDGSGGCWGLVHITLFNHVVFANGLYCTVGKPYYSKTWLAYRRKPEEGTR